MNALELANAVLFLSTLSLRRATLPTLRGFTGGLFLSTLSLRRATQAKTFKVSALRDFYPRSPCGERRPILSIIYLTLINFYPRSPCGERRFTERRHWHVGQFLSTLSLRRATLYLGRQNPEPGDFYPRTPCGERRPARITPAASRNFYPRSPCGERRQVKQTYRVKISISIHALLAESDEPATPGNNKNDIFLSTLSLRRATTPSE